MVNMIVLAAVLLKCAATAYACGGQILAQNFDKYSGGYQTWTKDMGKQDFDGLIFLKFDDFAEVGDGNLRVKNPQGAASPLKVYWPSSRCVCCISLGFCIHHECE